MSFVEQMANIGAEVSRALHWKRKNNKKYCDDALARALELLYLTIENATGFPRLKELCRLREALLDYFYGDNAFKSSDVLWEKYFNHFNYAARKERFRR